MTSSIEKYWYAVGFWHGKINQNTPPSHEEIEYIKIINGIDILEEYKKGQRASGYGNR